MPKRVYKRRRKKKAIKGTEVKAIEDNGLNSSHYHEVADRISIVEININRFLIETPVLQSPKHIVEKTKVEIAAQLLAEVYQELGQYL